MNEKHKIIQENINRKVLIGWVRVLGRSISNSGQFGRDLLNTVETLHKYINYNDKSF